MKNKKLAIITVNYQNYQITEEFLDCFKEVNQNNYKIFIADLSTKRQKLNHNNLIQIITAENKGYAYGVNICLKKALEQNFEQFAVINNDTRIPSDFTEKIQLSIEKHPASLIGGKIYYEKEFEYYKNKCQENNLGKVLWYAGGIVDWNNVYTFHRGVDEVDSGQYDKSEETEFITGCLMFFDKAAIEKIGFWDESYFLYYEDADFCQRAKNKRIKLYYDPAVVIWHKNAQSTGGSGSTLHQKYQEINRLKFGLKYAPVRAKIHLIKNFFLKKMRIK